uniref:hypothetical protein n=1 Tax=Pseudactinotalea sp. TaxID=1926260 RepID=UPI003B3A5830
MDTLLFAVANESSHAIAIRYRDYPQWSFYLAPGACWNSAPDEVKFPWVGKQDDIVNKAIEFRKVDSSGTVSFMYSVFQEWDEPWEIRYSNSDKYMDTRNVFTPSMNNRRLVLLA